ncbi:NADPH-dependent ferric siderophore reductase [Yersinia ruckeri]|uniref:siderophore-interacting protein n=1 Tax=Yersinia ruckeri TaxID=29486 RepID=UPI0004E44E03|nr:siderophore-interacting protein [Yersinia ruckeri]ARZ01270.1 Vibriobactin utilization protein ViuB [Yersinia ruckeri]EKN4181596.1 siderophore-interacting protein [Yersinia ruckeri]EKN4690605.1 siderophore-interacting protein [Yersinia ruckeri]ELI6451917.1 siderophore-interacting protein [Yersinia ruckeri]KFE39395.1 FAD-binding protein [Yersinia ruckeri]
MTTDAIVNNPPYRAPPPRLVQVKKVSDISPHLRRITFYSPSLANYPTDSAGAHLKLFLPQAGQTQPALPVFSDKGPIWPEGKRRPVVRTYTVRAIRPAVGEIDIEFAIHDHHGPAVDFARNAQENDWIGISNPGGPHPMLPAAQHYYLVGDPSSLPAIAALLASLPAQVEGQVIIRIDSDQDRIDLKKPVGIELNWIIGGTEKTDEIVTQFCSFDLPTENVMFWLAGEDKLVVLLRRYLRREKGCEREQLYAVPYWREGMNEEAYHQKRHDVMDNLDS